MSRVIALVATIPSRKRSCERVLAELANQTRPPDGIAFVLDGYGEDPAPKCSLPIVLEHRTPQLSGAGNRWRVVAGLLADDIVVNVDDDMILLEAPRFVARLAEAVEKHGGAAGAIGRTFDGKGAPPGAHSRGDLMHAAGIGLSARAGVLAGIVAFADEVKTAGGPDALGPQGDDDALMSAFLWKSGVKIKHAAVGGNVYTEHGTVSTFKKQADPNIQKRAIAKATGWPWKVFAFLNGGDANA